ncbi:hypothetical protein QYF61_026649 [Mycteria americana]|uniref:Uncharacterized protein n=1 Tax=Mycteria americana TaxID=33587 RepID=A0AAN7NLY0_MYCAM|nr:hypothetical protein QYF61_026649 [Mycteria americana]
MEDPESNIDDVQSVLYMLSVTPYGVGQPRGHWGQLSRLCPLPTPCAPPASSLVGWEENRIRIRAQTSLLLVSLEYCKADTSEQATKTTFTGVLQTLACDEMLSPGAFAKLLLEEFKLLDKCCLPELVLLQKRGANPRRILVTQASLYRPSSKVNRTTLLEARGGKPTEAVAQAKDIDALEQGQCRATAVVEGWST